MREEGKVLRIVPSLLGQTWDEFLERLRQAEAFADYVQIDLMDGRFVPTTSSAGALLSVRACPTPLQ